MISWIVAICSATVSWLLRFRYNRPGVERDLKWIASVWYILTPWSNSRWALKLLLFTVVSGSYYYLGYRRRKKVEAEQVANKQELRKNAHCNLQHGVSPLEFDYNDARGPLQPVIFPCRTSHTRLFPKKHSFSYSYLFVGIPVGWRGYINTILSADLKTLPWRSERPWNSWFSVDSADYLARGEHLHGLQGKLDDYLISQVGEMNLCLYSVYLLSG